MYFKVAMGRGRDLLAAHARQKCWEKFKPKPELTVSKYSRIIAVNGGESSVLGQVQVQMEVEGVQFDIVLLVIDDSRYDVIVGRDFMSKNIGMLEYWRHLGASGGIWRHLEASEGI